MPGIGLEETFRDPQVISNETVITIEHPRLGTISGIRPGFRLPGTLDIPRNPPPDLGVDTERLLDELGYSSSAIEEFRNDQII